MYEGLEKLIPITTEVVIISEYVKILNTRGEEDCRKTKGNIISRV